MYFCVNEFEVGGNDSILSGNEQQKVYFEHTIAVEQRYVHETLLSDVSRPLIAISSNLLLE